MNHLFVGRLGGAARLLVLIGALLISVQSQQQPTFEVVSVKPNGTQPTKAPSYIRYGPQTVDAGYYSLRGLILDGYRLQSLSILSSESRANEILDGNYNIMAKADHGVPTEQLRLMLQRSRERIVVDHVERPSEN
jgi:hypothetical protein